MINGTEDEETLKRLNREQAAEFYVAYVRILEKLRDEIDTLRGMAARLGDYIDRGHPDPKESSDALDEMQSHNKNAEILLEKLRSYIAGFREYCPEVLNFWADAHIRVCRFFLETLPAKSEDEKTALHVAKATLDLWKGFNSDTTDFISTDTPWLAGYSERMEYELSRATGNEQAL